MKHYLLLILSFFSFSVLNAQTNITGKITDNTNEPLIGAGVAVKGTSTGTVSNVDGDYKLVVDAPTPFTLVFSYLGFKSQEIVINGDQSNLNVKLSEESSLLQEVVISASRVEEKLLESPVSIEKLDLQAIKSSGSTDYFDQMTKLKGVSGTSGSMTFNSINTRGFASINNTRFVQLVDGIDNSAPLLNFPMGNLIGIGENDIKSVELVPGAASALYGPNAFNGIMIMDSKNPFDYQGLTVSFKQGFSKAENDNANPMTNADLRYAKAWGKFGFKVTGSYFRATDWKANDYNTDVVSKEKYTDELTIAQVDGKTVVLGDKPLQFNGMNTYGDENVLSSVPLGLLPAGHPTREALTNGVAESMKPYFGGDVDAAKAFISSRFKYLPTVDLRRTGIREEDLLDNRNATSAKVNAALHFKPTSDIDINYAFRFGHGNSIYQSSEKYVLRNFTSFSNKLEATGKNFVVRTYMTQTNAGDSYNMTALGSYTNELLAGTSAKWAPTYLGQIVGTFMGAALQNPGDTAGLTFKSPDLFKLANVKARNAADALLPARGSQAYNDAIQAIKATLFQHADPSKGILGGSSFIDHSRLFHTEATYDFTSLAKNKLGILVGANHRLYSLQTEGTVFNQDPKSTGKENRIKINEFGAFTQLTKKLINERLRISASIRYDKNENFKGVWSPRVATVATLGDKRQHNIRASFQTGFRNPDTQAQFIYFPVSTILMGGAKKNAKDYGIYEGGSYSLDSYNAFVAGGRKDSTKLETFNMDYIKPEKLSNIEVGYKAVINNLYIDWNAYFNWYKDFITQGRVVAKKSFEHKKAPVAGAETGSPKVISPYYNVNNRVTSWGSGIALSYKLPKGLNANANYSYLGFNSGDIDEKKIDFNSPTHMFNVGFSGTNVGNSSVGFNVAYRWQNEFWWYSTFGSGNIEAFGSLDASLSYNLKNSNTTIKAGATNIAGPDYNTNIGAPMIGRTFFVGLTYDGTLSRKK
ncbi:MAG: carboxypeptidase-like regulatory domain-containing protein [Chitinophagales bacterium]|nr:carboxypeptidase-like regulatory domain-containing protein [Chitinophagales bacterium]